MLRNASTSVSKPCTILLLNEVLSLNAQESVDAVLIAGDVFLLNEVLSLNAQEWQTLGLNMRSYHPQ